MRWEAAEVESILETIWDLHDKVSDAIHAISRAHFLRSVRAAAAAGSDPAGLSAGGEGARGGFVFVKGFDADLAAEAAAEGGLAEARSLHTIRSALEDLEDQLEFFHTVQSLQLAERNSAVARLEQSRIILAMRLAEHQGRKYPVIQEALEFIGNVHGKGQFVSPEDFYRVPQNQLAVDGVEGQGERGVGFILRMFSIGVSVAKNSLKLETFSGVLGNAALLALSMLALLQLNQAVTGGSSGNSSSLEPGYTKRVGSNNDSHPDNKMSHLDVLLARG